MPSIRLLCYLSLLFPVALFFSSCSSQVKAKGDVTFKFIDGETAKLVNGRAYAPRRAPAAVKRAIAAGNRLQNSRYKWGGGRVKGFDQGGYDCSGATSYVLREAGLLNGSLTSRGFLQYGKKGEGDWITIYARNGHVFMTIAGLRLDTGGGGRTGPRWKPERRRGKGHILRHPRGL